MIHIFYLIWWLLYSCRLAQVSKMHHRYFSLIHADFNKYLVSSLGNYFTDTSLTDVTFVSDEQIPFKAHKFILNVSSPLMEDLLLSNPHSLPLIYLRGVKQQELVYILQFIYFGEANVQNKQIKKLLDITKDFKLRCAIKIIIRNPHYAINYWVWYSDWNI